jgi:acetyl-CoA decarbonylase/synthase complex subunit delta
VRGQWENINKYVYANSKQTIESFNAYSMLESPMTSCGCFEAIVALLPECNGVMLVNREYLGQTPAGMKFSTLASMAGGGQQTPGFLGIGKAYVTSRKFIAAEGGHRRIVWMPSSLKERLREDFEEIGKSLGIENFLDMIADETLTTDLGGLQEHLKKVNHPALSMWEITSPSPEAAAADAARAGKNNGAKTPFATSGVSPSETVAATAGAVAKPVASPPESAAVAVAKPVEVVPAAPVAAQASPIAAATHSAIPASADGVEEILTVLERLRGVPLRTQLQPEMSAEQQMAALQSSTALHLLHAGANMLLMYSGLLGPAPTASPASSAAAPVAESQPARKDEAPVETAKPAIAAQKLKPFSSARIVLPSSFKVPEEGAGQAIHLVTLGGSGTRTSAVTIGGAEVLPFRHFEGKTGSRAAIAMEVFDQEFKGYPQSLHEAYGALLNDPAAMAKYCVEQLGADVISVRLIGTHPENGDRSPEASADLIKDVLKAVGVPLIVTGTNHFEKNNAVMKHIAATFAGENLLLNWAETDNYKTIAAAAMGYNHCIVAQAPIDVNMSKQLNILLTNMGVAPEKIVIDPYTGALGYGLEYTYSVMERIRTSAFAGDAMLAMPMMTAPGYEVARTKESKAPVSAFPLWGPEGERGALIEIATATSLLNAGADLLVMYHPVAARTMKRKIEEMTAC